MQYRLINHKTKALSNKYLRSIYDLSNDSTEHIYVCIPNGEIGISVILNGQSHTKTDAGWIKQPSISVYGLVRKVQFHRMSPYYHEINLGFSPHYLQLFLKDCLHSISKINATDLFDLVKKDEANKLFQNLMQCKNDEGITDKIEGFLKRNLLHEELDKRILAAHQMIVHSKIWNVQSLSSLLNISSTGLRILFKERVGISPKDFIKIQRIKKGLDFKEHGEESLTQLAYHLKYFDQSHFIHDFKESIGLTPKQYFSNKELTFDFYNFQRWSYDNFAASLK
ncbi:MAG: helix-turn-helix transcriptional regulator [Bacteroidia bacterium]